MKQIPDYADERNRGWCIYCGGPIETRDHVPSRILLDDPLPAELPTVPACQNCNSSFSRDEEYLACLVDCVLAGNADACKRPKVRRALEHSEPLRESLRQRRVEMLDGRTIHTPDEKRVRNVILKLARGHMSYEQNEPQFDAPDHYACFPLIDLSEADREEFETGGVDTAQYLGWPEVGSRLMTRVLMGHDMGPNGWIIVQEGRYRYRVEGYSVSIVISEYLGAQVVW